MLVSLVGIGTIFLFNDPTPLLLAPGPDLDWPLGLFGAAAGLWAALRIGRLPNVRRQTLGRISLIVMIPLLLGYGMANAGSRLQEAFAFRQGTTMEQVVVKVLTTDRREGRKFPRKRYHTATVANPLQPGNFEIDIDAATFGRIEPAGTCARIMIERVPSGAARLIRPLDWNVACPGASGPAQA
ncbi:hypothetical protein V5740_09480 [Croceibacterium sp. TMG7-5b_MA50]|uniref:hypothetical protein n=1 Tax=Croceibacterium sp. TMG7-5b_MA50 TaxID=3121290 RepID=UPI003221D56E